LKRQPNAKLTAVPVSILGTVSAFHWDMGYGSKINRVNKMHQDILNDPTYWFNPIDHADSVTESPKNAVGGS